MARYSPYRKKILLMLLAGVALGLTYSPRGQKKILKAFIKDWKNIERDRLYYLLNEFKYERLIDYQESSNGTIKVILTENGKKKALQYDFDEIKIKKPSQWDGKWRLVIFDIPERIRKGRDALRDKLKDLDFYELQKSVWVHPYPCEDEINFITEVFDLRSYIRFAEIIKITNEAKLKLHFKLY
ncbi:MAG: hypothetical protein AB1643_00530 [Patescibacteria group bacterium]